MNRNVPASFGLSVLTVLFFAIALYQPDPPVTRAVADRPALAPAPETAGTAPPSEPAAPVETGPIAGVVPPATPPAEAAHQMDPDPLQVRAIPPLLPETRTEDILDKPSTSPVPPPVSEAHAQPTVTLETTPTSVRPVAARPASARLPKAMSRPAPRGAYTESRAGESLPDIALRVYGSAASAKSLWLANRDILDRPDAPLAAGTLLRTP